uniref:Uncharacterized protein n=1 Tax=Knipowitschia caucasica TaxID=637954 RepID=A0AAV2LQF6_KNICA
MTMYPIDSGNIKPTTALAASPCVPGVSQEAALLAHSRNSPEAGWQQRRGEKYSGPERRSPSPYNRRSSSPYNSRSDSPGRQNLKPTGDVVFNAPEQRRGVRFLSPDHHQQGNGM